MLIGIQGFGRIGRTLLRVLWGRGDEIRVAEVADPAYSVSGFCNAIEFDTNYGRFPGEVEQVEGDAMLLRDVRRTWPIAFNAGNRLQDFNHRLDAIVCATGRFDYLSTELDRVFLTFRSERAHCECVLGVSGTEAATKGQIVSCSTCDAVALAPVLAAINELTGFERVAVTTLHPWLSHQRLVDGPAADPRALPQLGRAAPGALIPKPTSLGETIAALLPDLGTPVRCMSFRVPTATVCIAQIYALTHTSLGRQAILDTLASKIPIIRIESKPVVSSDLIGDVASAVVLEPHFAVDDREIFLTIAYDNEWGYCARIADVLALHNSERRDPEDL